MYTVLAELVAQLREMADGQGWRPLWPQWRVEEALPALSSPAAGSCHKPARHIRPASAGSVRCGTLTGEQEWDHKRRQAC